MSATPLVSAVVDGETFDGAGLLLRWTATRAELVRDGEVLAELDGPSRVQNAGGRRRQLVPGDGSPRWDLVRRGCGCGGRR